MADLGLDLSLQIFSDSSAAKAFASRRGLGRQRHVQTRHLWLQERVAAAHFTIQKVGTTQNPADILTKAASRETLERYRKMFGLRRDESHSSQKELRLGSLAANQCPKCAPFVAKQLTCREREHVNSQDSGIAEVVGTTGMRKMMEVRMSLPWTSSSFLLSVLLIINLYTAGVYQIRWDRLRDC